MEFRFTGYTPEKPPVAKNKLLTYTEAPKLISGLRGNRMEVVYIDGVFDLVHTGHLEICELARKAGDKLIVGIKPDEMVAKVKGPERPIRPAMERARLLAGLGAVDYTVILPDLGTQDFLQWRTEILKFLNPTFYGVRISDEYMDEKYTSANTANVEIAHLYASEKTQSTTNIVRKIRESAFYRS